MKATAKDLRIHSKQLLDAVSRGEEVIITYRGKPQAKLVALDSDAAVTPDPEDELWGIWKDNPEVDSVTAFVDNVRSKRF